MLADVVEHLGVDDPRLDSPRFLEPPPKRLGDRQRIAQRAAKSLRALLQLGKVISLRLDVVADPGFRGDQDTRVGAGFVGGLALKLADRGVEPDDRVGCGRCVVR
jgi:hypothetical protein